MYLSKLFLCLLPFAKQKPSWSLTKISKLVRDSALNVGVKWVKVRRAFGIVFVFFASLYLYIFAFCICADTALRMLLSFSQPCQSASPPPLAGSRNIHQQSAAMMMRAITRTTMTTMMRTTRTTTKIQKPVFDCYVAGALQINISVIVSYHQLI